MVSRPGLVVALGALALAPGGCGSSGGTPDHQLEGLVLATAPPPVAIDVARAARDAAALTEVVALPWSRAAAQLGDHTVAVKTTMEVREGTAVLERLDDATTLALAADGTYHAVYENSADYGREVVWRDDALFLRPRYARWHRRAPEAATEPTTIRDQLVGALGAHLALYAHGLEVSDKGAAPAAGRAGRAVELKLAPSPRPAPRPALTQHAWREGATVEAAAGEVVLDDATGLPLRARVAATVGFVRDGKRLTMHLTVEHAVTVGPVTVEVPPAEDTVATPTRAREVDDRNMLLEGIAPALGKGARSAPP